MAGLLLGVGALVVAGVFAGRPVSRADVELTMDAGMVKGAPTPRVTIVEFSDYQ